MKNVRNPDAIHPPLAAYSHQVEISGERLLIMAGQLGRRAARPRAANVLANLEAADMEVGDLVKLTLYFVEEIDAPTRGGILARRLGEHRPAMTLVYIARLAAPPLLVEVDAWASASG